MSAKKVLGKGLSALLGSIEADGDLKRININEIEPSLDQPRKNFDDKKIKDLATSIKRHGIIQPILVKKEESCYRIIAGERRWRAAKIAGLNEMPVIIKKSDKRETMEIALIENIQRENLNPIEEAIAYNELIKEYNLTHEELAKLLGKSRSVISNAIRLLKLSDKVKEALEQSVISTGHARTLSVIEEEEIQNDILKLIIEKNMTVRDLEKHIRENFSKATKKILRKRKKTEFLDLEKEIQEVLGTKISIRCNKRNKGRIIIEFFSKEEMERIINFLLNQD